MSGDTQSAAPPDELDGNAVIKPFPLKHVGVVAKHDILKGTLLAVDKPIFQGTGDWYHPHQLNYTHIADQVARLTPAMQSKFWTLISHNQNPSWHHHNNHILSNLIMLSGDSTGEVDEEETSGVFLSLGRVNHSCVPNSYPAWNKQKVELSIYALQDLKKGEEITISYYRDLPLKNARRKKYIKKTWGFDCACAFCRVPDYKQDAFDLFIDRLYKTLHDPSLHLRPPHDVLVQFRDSVASLHRLDMFQQFAAIFYQKAFVVAACCGDAARAAAFGNLMTKHRITMMGPNHPRVIMDAFLEGNPSQHPLFGMWSHWKSDVSDIPKHLSPDDYEKWLWTPDVEVEVEVEAEPSSQAPRELATFSDRKAFMGLSDLPIAGQYDEAFYYTAPEVPKPQFRRNWCFFGHIVGVRRLGITTNPQLLVEDRDGKQVRVSFLSNDPMFNVSNNLSPFPGQTIIVMYATKHQLVENPNAFELHVEFRNEFCIFKASLGSLLNLGETVSKYANPLPIGRGDTPGAAVYRCRAGDSEEASFPCPGCNAIFFCSGGCKDRNWASSHSTQECLLLGDKVILALLKINWKEFNGLIGTPLS